MNIANKLTLFRVVIVPFFVFFMCFTGIEYRYLFALILFILASITDMLDGKIARKYNMVTNFGKFLDPLADKILVAAALVCFVELGWTTAWVVFIVLAREFAVSGVRLAAVSGDKKAVIPANIWGKLKTAFTMIAIIAVLFMHILESFGVICNIVPDEYSYVPSAPQFPIQIISDVLMYITAALTLISGIKYVYDAREYINPNK